jgi:hypothetical protein
VIPPLILIWDTKAKLGYSPFIILLGIAFLLTFKKEYLSFYKEKKRSNI